MEILIPAGIMGALGLLLAGALFAAAKKFYVYEDPRIDEVELLLPGANCGGCGKAGCRAFAEALVAGEEGISCPVASSESMEKIAEVLGVEMGGAEPKVAHVMCEGLNTSAEYAGSYHGVEDCRAAHLVGQVDRMCSYGCIGLGTCLDACNFDAIEIYRGVARIIPENCVACEACVEACPREIIDMIPKGRQVFVPCKSFDAGKRTSRVCEIGCIGCKKCVKVCPSEAIGFDNNLAWIKYDKCTLCYECVEACPRHIIKVRDLEHYVLHESDLKQGFDRIAAAKRAEEQDRKAKEEKAKQEAAAKAGGEDPETAAKREKIKKSIADARAKAEHDPEYATKLPKILAGFEKKLAALGPEPGEDPELAAKRQKIKQALADARKKAKEDPEYAKRFPKIEAGFMAKLEALDPSSKAAEHEAEKLGGEEVGE